MNRAIDREVEHCLIDLIMAPISFSHCKCFAPLVQKGFKTVSHRASWSVVWVQCNNLTMSGSRVNLPPTTEEEEELLSHCTQPRKKTGQEVAEQMQLAYC